MIDGKTGIFFDQPTVPALIGAIREFINRENDFNPDFIHRHAESFSKERFKNEMVKLIHQELKSCGKL